MKLYILFPLLLIVTSCDTLPRSIEGAMSLTLSPPQFVEPPTSVTVDEKFDVVVQRTQSLPCISVMSTWGPVTLLISRRLLENLVSIGQKDPDGNPNGLKYEPSNHLVGKRAERLLESTSEILDSHGCALTKKETPVGTSYLLGALLQRGQLAVVDNKTGDFVHHIWAHFRAQTGASGEVTYSLPEEYGSTYILLSRTWVH